MRRILTSLAIIASLAASAGIATADWTANTGTGTVAAPVSVTLQSTANGSKQIPNNIVVDPATLAGISPATAGKQDTGNTTLTSIYNALIAPLPTGTNVVGKVGVQVGGTDVSAANPVPTAGTQASSIATGQVSCGTTAAQVVAARTGRRNVVLLNEGTAVVRFGAAGVTTTTGALLPGAVGASATIGGGAAVFCATAAGTQTVSFYEEF